MKNLSSIWAIRPDAVAGVLNMILGNNPQANSGKPSMQRRVANKIAVIPIHGILTTDGPAWMGSTYGDIADAVEKCAADPDVKHIVLSVDSPGGEVNGLPECAAVIAAAARVKSVSAMVEGTAASAAYWLTSQAHDITLTPSGEVGSVGVRMMHVDMSAALEKAGLKVTELQAGKFKTEWSPHKPLSEEAQRDMQSRLNATHEDFIDAVSRGRGRRGATAAKTRFGEGRMFSAKDALRLGMIDSLASPNAFYRGLTSQAKPEPRTTALNAPERFAPAAVAMTDGAIAMRRARLELERTRLTD